MGVGGWQHDFSQKKDNQRHPQLKPYAKQVTTTEDKANVQETIWVYAILLRPHHLYCLFSVLLGQEKAMWKSRHGHLLLFYHCILIMYEYVRPGQLKWTKWAQTTPNYKNNKYLDFYMEYWCSVTFEMLLIIHLIYKFQCSGIIRS